MPNSIDYARQLAAEMLDDELMAIVDKMKDGSTPSLFQSAVLDELAHRQLSARTERFTGAQRPAYRPTTVSR